MTLNISLQFSYVSLFLSPFLSLNLVIFEYSCFALLENENFKFTSKAPSSPTTQKQSILRSFPLNSIWTGDVSHRNQEAYSLCQELDPSRPKIVHACDCISFFRSDLKVFVTVLIHLPSYLLSYTHPYLNTLTHPHTYTTWDTTRLPHIHIKNNLTEKEKKILD